MKATHIYFHHIFHCWKELLISKVDKQFDLQTFPTPIWTIDSLFVWNTKIKKICYISKFRGAWSPKKKIPDLVSPIKLIMELMSFSFKGEWWRGSLLYHYLLGLTLSADIWARLPAAAPALSLKLSGLKAFLFHIHSWTNVLPANPEASLGPSGNTLLTLQGSAVLSRKFFSILWWLAPKIPWSNWRQARREATLTLGTNSSCFLLPAEWDC